MGSSIEVNDTLQITEAQGFPAEILDLATHQSKPITIDDVKDKLFSFKGKKNARVYQSDPVRVFLVHNINDKWLFWGHALIQSQQIEKSPINGGVWDGTWETSGTFKISRIYTPEQQLLVTKIESPKGKSYFGE